LIKELQLTEGLAYGSKWVRFIHQPFKYSFAFFFRKFIYPITKKEYLTTAKLFWGKEMYINLPASTDIYLTHGKSHDSEIRFSKYLIHNLKKGDQFLDIGAHYGFFSLLSKSLVGDTGKVRSYEPTKASFQVVNKNLSSELNCSGYNLAVSDNLEPIIFYEFPNLQSEYNTTDISQFEDKDWFKNESCKKVQMETTTIDTITGSDFKPNYIKIDVEGAENKVIKGGVNFLKENNPIIIMEYISKTRGNANHQSAVIQMQNLNYKTYTINSLGSLEDVGDLDTYLIHNNLESDNIVFIKKEY
jgi:FkbM family methyltransferase